MSELVLERKLNFVRQIFLGTPGDSCESTYVAPWGTAQQNERLEHALHLAPSSKEHEQWNALLDGCGCSAQRYRKDLSSSSKPSSWS